MEPYVSVKISAFCGVSFRLRGVPSVSVGAEQRRRGKGMNRGGGIALQGRECVHSMAFTRAVCGA